MVRSSFNEGRRPLGALRIREGHLFNRSGRACHCSCVLRSKMNGAGARRAGTAPSPVMGADAHTGIEKTMPAAAA